MCACVHVRVQDTLKLLGQLGPIDWKTLLRSPGKLYMGITPAVIETGAYNGINFGVYELVKLYYQRRTGAAAGALVPDLTNLLMGLVSSVITQVATSPLKVVAVRLGSGNTSDRSMAEAYRNVWKEGGVGAFFRGNLAGLTSQPITIALSFYFFERLRFYAERAFGASPAVTLITGSLAVLLPASWSVFAPGMSIRSVRVSRDGRRSDGTRARSLSRAAAAHSCPCCPVRRAGPGPDNPRGLPDSLWQGQAAGTEAGRVQRAA